MNPSTPFMHLVKVNVAPERTLRGTQEISPVETFEEIWGQEARWIMGPGVLSDIVRFLQNRSLVAEVNLDDVTSVDITLPFPTIRDEVSGEPVSIICMVPEELRPVFFNRWQMIADTRAGAVVDALKDLLGRPVEPLTLSAMNDELRLIEMRAKQMGKQELWMAAAAAFGLPLYSLAAPPFASSDDDRG